VLRCFLRVAGRLRFGRPQQTRQRVYSSAESILYLFMKAGSDIDPVVLRRRVEMVSNGRWRAGYK